MQKDGKRTVLIIDDQEINREILKSILQDEYDISEAENGEVGLSALQNSEARVSAVLLDIMMPVMDGYGFLKAIKGTVYSGMPIIVLTGESREQQEEQALENGAWDFISKPYQPVILKSRLKNAIARSEMGEFNRIKHLAEHDLMTDLFNRQTFYNTARKMIDRNPDQKFVLIRLDIDSFKLVNSFWGEKEGDRLLKFIGHTLEDMLNGKPFCTYGRINSDIFCVCCPNDTAGIDSFTEDMKMKLLSYKASFYVKPTFGIYEITKPSYTLEAMYERATLAAQKCKGKYNQYTGYYDSGLHDHQVKIREIENEMQSALDSGQFKIYLQPKYDLKTNLPCGAEALVRWQHPERGMISPGEFIPVFEQNGFISELDYYVWDQVCALIRKWMDAGLNPSPVSVNVSRVDMYNPHVVNVVRSLTKKYGIPESLLNLELTESAYMDNPDTMKKVVADLQKNGFTVMMDDFGSGYSSLNTLQDIHVDVLKIDMKFLSGRGSDGRSEQILASVIRMAGWLNLSVIVEGVETEQQAVFLRSIGCGYVQGYFFARPMPVEQYEELVGKNGQASSDMKYAKRKVDINKVVWAFDEDSESVLNALSSPAAIFEYSRQMTEVLRVNKMYNDEFGYGDNVFSPEKLSSYKDGRGLTMAEILAEISSGETGPACVLKMSEGVKSYDLLYIDCIGKYGGRMILTVVFLKAAGS